MGIPSECKMPDLLGLVPLIGRLIVQLLVGGDVRLSRKASLYRKNFIRLVDKALREYHAAREALLGEIQGTQRSFLIEFTNHIETCINAVSRLFKLLERIKSEKESPAFPRELRRLVETKNEPITNVRNVVEHIDEHIQKDEIAPGKSIMLALSKNDDGVVISNFEIKFKELAMVLEKMHEIARHILTVKKIEVTNCLASDT